MQVMTLKEKLYEVKRAVFVKQQLILLDKSLNVQFNLTSLLNNYETVCD